MPFLYLLLFLASNLFTTSKGELKIIRNIKIPDCPSFDCGDNVNITYPFWVSQGGSPSSNPFCGYPELEITCINNTASFKTLSDNYTVTNISVETRTFSLFDTDVKSSDCPRVRHQVDLSHYPNITYTPQVVNLTFFFNCAPDLLIRFPLLENNLTKCLQDGARTSYVFVGEVSPIIRLGLSASCGGSVVSPVLTSSMPADPTSLTQSFGDVLKRGFELQWKEPVMNDCLSCQRTNGYCGYKNSSGYGGLDFICFCGNGTQTSYSCTAPKVFQGYRDCRNGTILPCGSQDHNISYPFLAEGRPQNCGHPSYDLKCSNGDLTINIDGNTYLVKDINYETSVLTAVHNASSVDTCSYSFQNTTLDWSLFTYTNQDINLTLYNCSMLSIPLPEVGCPFPISGWNWYYYLGDNIPFPSAGSECSSPVFVPLLQLEAENLKDGFQLNEFTQVLQEGFEVEWTAGSDWCNRCMESGGACGYNSSKPSEQTCYCSDETRTGSCSSKGLSTLKKALIAIFSILGFLFLVALGYLFVRRTKNKKRVNSSRATLMRSISSEPSAFNKDPESQSMTSNYLTHIFSYKELDDATDGFSSSKEVGDGGFGTVYKGSLRDGRTVAVKRLYENNYRRLEQFMNEVAIVHRLRHPSLVSLYGCTSRHSRELLLVYEYVPNGTVADHLHGSRAEERALTWSARVNIAIETADALAYLHANEPQIIHRDVKTNNILLDNSYHVKVADFGLSREFPLDATHVSTAPQGTPGYVDPEYHQCYQLTDKSDVYSFGVVLVELISSKPAVDITRRRQEINLSNMAINKIREGVINELADPELGYDSDPEVKRMIDAMAEVAFLCLQAERDARPTMKDVKAELINIVHGDGNEKNDDGEKQMKDDADVKAELINIVHGDGNEKNDDGEKQMKDDAYLLNSNVPPSPDTVTMKWYSTTTTPNTSA